MHWTAPSERDTNNTLERLWDSADQFRAKSGPNAQEYFGPILADSSTSFNQLAVAAVPPSFQYYLCQTSYAGIAA
jgi:hypothetical protein